MCFINIRNGETGITNTIWECSYDFDAKTRIPTTLQQNEDDDAKYEIVDGGWKVERIRTDKKTANDIRVVESVYQVRD